MINFTYCNPTKIIFGKGVLSSLGDEAQRLGKRAMLVYGKESLKKYGVYQTIREQLKNVGIEVADYGGVQENPLLSFARKGVEIARENKIDFLIAAGGGSAMDTAKAICAGVKSENDIWDFFEGKAKIENALPLITVVTMPATGSESNPFTVLTNEETQIKSGLGNPLLYPKVSFLDPELTLTIPLKSTAFAAVDIMAHVMEGFFTNEENFSPVQDGYALGIACAVVESVRRIIKNPKDIDARGSLMWAATLAWNGLTFSGVKGAAVPCHILSYPLSSLYGKIHGEALAIIFPAWLKHRKNKFEGRIKKFGKFVFDMPAASADEIIAALENFYKEIGAPARMSEAGINNPPLDKMTEQVLTILKMRAVPNLAKEDIENVFRLSI